MGLPGQQALPDRWPSPPGAGSCGPRPPLPERALLTDGDSPDVARHAISALLRRWRRRGDRHLGVCGSGGCVRRVDWICRRHCGADRQKLAISCGYQAGPDAVTGAWPAGLGVAKWVLAASHPELGRSQSPVAGAMGCGVHRPGRLRPPPDTCAGRRRDRRLSQRSAAPDCRWQRSGPAAWRKPPGYFSFPAWTGPGHTAGTRPAAQRGACVTRFSRRHTAGAPRAGRPGPSRPWSRFAIRPGPARCPGRCRGTAACPGREPPGR